MQIMSSWALMVDFRAGGSCCSMINSFVTKNLTYLLTYTLIGREPTSPAPPVEQKFVTGTFSQLQSVWGEGRVQRVVNNSI